MITVDDTVETHVHGFEVVIFPVMFSDNVSNDQAYDDLTGKKD
jgi:hypothetical protein